jgi:DNA helicase II / ATP-dependent DNA helicase PcrA
MNLSEEQSAVVNAREGIWVTIASPGSGKTRCITERYIKLIVSKVPSSNILSLTFTNEASSEMAKRSGVVDAKSVFRTFHSFALNLLQAERSSIPFEMCDTIIPVEMQNYELLFRLCKTYPAIKHFRTLREKISLWKQTGVSPERALEEANDTDYFLALAYQDYERISREEGWLDFDSLQQEAVRLLETNEAVRSRWQYQFVQIDEAQDCDASQFRIVELISEKHRNIMAVGDENQLIYEWRGAQANSLTNFSQRFAGAQKLYLSTNYRSTKNLVKFFREILPVDNGLASRMDSAREEGENPVIIRYGDDREEAEVILNQIKDTLNTAIIARTNRQLFVFEKLCVMRGIKYRILGKKDFFEQSEIVKLLKLAKDKKDEFQGVRAAEALQMLIHQHRLLEIYKASDDPTEATPAENLNDICKMAGKHENLPVFLDHLRKLTHARKSSKGLILSTVHQSKGREYPTVYLVGVNQGTLPHSKGELNEEKRIFFVGASRAGDHLYISFNSNRSMFLNNYQHLIRVYNPEGVV